jgi:hypothetical protein
MTAGLELLQRMLVSMAAYELYIAAIEAPQL